MSNAAAITHVTPASTETRLTSLGLSLHGIVRVLDLALGDRLACTENDPPSFPGQMRSARAVRYLREEYLIYGWKADNTANYCRLIDEHDITAIAVSTGDGATGDPTGFPKLAHRKGEMTMLAVQENDQQLDLFGEAPITPHNAGPMTWILLLNERNNLMYAELSLPRKVHNGNVIEWEERIILPSRPIGTFDFEMPEPAAIDEIRIDRK